MNLTNFYIRKDINLDEIDEFIDPQNNSTENLGLLEDFNNDFGLNNISCDYDDDDISNREGIITDENEDILLI